ncbi:MAG: High molecular weight rubredoxin [Deltaproteobacteria bacterium DG_8]|nr:MAG: High molecular weight rubredoxin [Deltaproteobacteria bacterium DG_8]
MDPKALYKISYGLYVITSKKGDQINGQTANALIQVTAEPPAIAIGINKQNLTNEFIKESKVFTVSILSQDTPLNFIGQFGFKSGRDINKFDQVNYKLGKTGAPIVLDNTLAYLEVKVNQEIDVGTHTIFVGEIVDSEVLKDGEPMTYAYYHQVKRGTTPKTAPTYRKEEKKPVSLPKYQCTVCRYIYDPEKGDPDGGIAPGTPFEDIPANWKCPVCGASKDQFEKV